MLIHANEALRKGVAGLQHLDDLSDFLGKMLKAAADISSAQTGWVVLLASDSLTYRFAAMMTRDGELVPQEEIPSLAISVTVEFSAWLTGMSHRATARPQSLHHPLHSEEIRTFNTAQGNQSLVNLPMRAADRLIGWLGLGFSEADASLGPAHLVLEVLADQMTMAVELSRLGELKKRTALTQEAEKTAEGIAAELAEANETIGSTLGQFIRSHEPETFVRFALLEAARQTHAVAGQVFRYTAKSNELRQICAVRDDEVFPEGHSDDPVEFQSGFNADMTSAYRRFCKEGGVIWFSTDPPHPSAWPFLAFWNLKMKHAAYAGIALLARGLPVGLLVLEFSDGSGLTEIQVRLLTALGRQISLALEIADRPGRNRHTAVAQKRENTERERAAELIRANGAIKRSADRLASYPTTKAYLDAVLLETSVATGARSAVIFEFDLTGEWLYLTACAIDGEIVNVTTDPLVEILRRPVQISPEGSALIQQGSSRWFHLDSDAHLIWQFAIPWHRQMGHKTLAVFPLIIGNRSIGRFGLCFTTEQRPPQRNLELCSTLSQHAALAIELNRLSDDAKQAAVLAEREKAARALATELLNANAAMQRSTERLSGLNDLDEFIVEVLKTVEEVTGAVGSTVFLYDESSQTARAKAMVLEGSVRDFSNDPELLPFRNPVSLAGPELQKWERVFSSSGYHWSNVEDETHRPDTRAWHRARGLCTIVHFPLRRNTRRIGLLALSFRQRFPPVPARLDLVGVLAQQLILAIETARLGEEAKQAAIVFEREKAAAEQAGELARANSSFLTTLDILARESELSFFLRHVLSEAMKHLEAHDGIMFVLNSDDETVSPAYSILDESSEADPKPSYLDALSDACAGLVQARKPLLFQIDRDETLFAPEMRSWHKARGTRTIVGVPMFIGGEAIGYVCLCVRRDCDDVSSFALAQVQALVQQAALALQLARLANAESKEKIAREHEKASSEHAAELAKANDVMKRTASRLLQASDPDAILPVIVSEACRIIGATRAAMFEYRPEHQHLVFICGVENGELSMASPGDLSGDPANPMPIGEFPAWKDLLTRNQPTFEKITQHIIASRTVQPPEAGKESTIMQSVLSMDNQPLGFFSLALSEGCQPSQVALDTFNMLVQQATLALRMGRLSKEAESRATEAATLEERNRIAREIHDTLAQSFTGVLMQLQAIDHLRVESNREQVHLDNAVSIARNGLDQARRSVKALRPSELDSGSLIDALKLVAHLTEKQSDVSVVVCGDASAAFETAHSAEILRIIQEAITNAVKHARANLITVECSCENGSPEFAVRDNGVGFNPERKTEGFGLIGMRERAARICGELRVSSGSDGTVVHLILSSPKESS